MHALETSASLTVYFIFLPLVLALFFGKAFVLFTSVGNMHKYPNQTCVHMIGDVWADFGFSPSWWNRFLESVISEIKLN